MRPTYKTRIVWLVVLLTGGSATARLVAAEGQERVASRPGFDRPHPDVVRETTRQVLSDPKFAPYRTFWQWLMDALSGWKGPNLGFAAPWLEFLGWFFLAWCILALVVVLGHIVWVIVSALRGRFGSGAWVRSRMASQGHQALSYEELIELMRRLAGQGAFRDAMSAMMAALLHWLDTARILGFHQSKTNGDYIREFPESSPARDEFRRFVLAFERTIYGGEPCDERTFQELEEGFRRIRGHVQLES